MEKQQAGQNKKREQILSVLGILIFLAVEFWMHRSMHFYNDDWWYETNLVTGKPLASIGDIWESQVWHFYNWGGRNITHGLLQLVLMQGELVADILNLCMTVLLSLVMCRLADVRGLRALLVGNLLFVVCNAAPVMNLTWEAGSVNYLYSTTWIFFFIYLYKRAMEGKKKYPLVEVWILPLAFITGWSTENMGPAAFCIAAAAAGYFVYREKKRPPVWMLEGGIACLLGCIPLILAPGNFVRSAIAEESAGQILFHHVESEFVATVNFLCPILTVSTLLIFCYVITLGKKLNVTEVGLILFAVLAHGAMFLSPTYPSRATFGVMAILCTLLMSIGGKMVKELRMLRFGLYILYGLGLVYMVGMAVYVPMG